MNRTGRIRRGIENGGSAHFACHAAELGDRIRKWRRRRLDREPVHDASRQAAQRHGARSVHDVLDGLPHVGNPDSVDEHIRRDDAPRGTKAPLARECDLLVRIAQHGRHEAWCRGRRRFAQKDRRGRREICRRAVAGDAEPADEMPVLVKRDAAGGIGQRAGQDRRAPHAGRNAARVPRRGGCAEVGRIEWRRGRERICDLFEPVDVGKKQVRETDAHERAGRCVGHARREMLLDDISRGARGERFLIAAQECRRARPRDRACEEAVDSEDCGIVNVERRQRTRNAALHVPDSEDETFAVGDGNDCRRIRESRVRRRLRDDLGDLGCGELLSAALRPRVSRREDHARQRSQGEDGSLHERVDLSGSARRFARQTFMRSLSVRASKKLRGTEDRRPRLSWQTGLRPVRTAEDGCLPGQPGRLSSIPSATF